jgi:acyl-[acyl-carrier-protein]-phospholipid O-acyltransferase/long-chain-fatty-acid--[acyl-carrier-protein] ligase
MVNSRVSTTSLAALLVAQTLVSFASNAAKMLVLALALVPGVLAPGVVGEGLALLPVAIAAPYVFLSPLFAWFADRFSTRTVLSVSILLLLALLGVLAFALHVQSVPLTIVAFLLLSMHSALVSPSKRAMLREVAPPEKYGQSVLLLEMLTLGAIVAGAYSGARALEAAGLAGDMAMGWVAAERYACVLPLVTACALVAFLPTRPTSARAVGAPPQELLTRPINHLFELLRTARLRSTALGILFFNMVGGAVVMVLIDAGRDWASQHPGTVSVTGLAATLLLFAGAGALAGNFFAGVVSRFRSENGLVPFGAAGMAVAAWWASHNSLDAPAFRPALVLLGFSAGIYLAPLHIYFQHRVGKARRTRMGGALNLFRGVGGVAAGGLYYLMAVGLHWTLSRQLACLAVASSVVAVVAVWLSPEHLMLLLFRALGRVLYRLRIQGLVNLPTGGALIVSNHISYVDALILQVLFPRKLWFLAVHGRRRRGLPLWFYRVTGVIPLSSEKATEGLRLAIHKMKEGELVCVFPEGQVSRTGALMEIRKGFEVLAKRAEVPVVPVFIDSLWGSIFTYANQKLVFKLPERFPHSVLVQVGPPLSYRSVNAVLARQALLDLGERAYQQREELKRHLGYEVLRSVARHPWKVSLIDCTATRKEVRAGTLLAAAATYAKLLRREVPERRVGIVLPPSAGGFIANLAVLLAGKIPVNLNFTAGASAIEASLRMGEIRTVITAEAMRVKIPHFPWPEKTRDMAADLTGCGKPAILARLALIWLMPSRLLALLWNVPRVGDNAETALLFTSGSSGEPKGVPLTHRNILGNCGQISATGILSKKETPLVCLPIFHSFGFTVMWYVLMRGVPAVTLPSPLDAKRIVEVVENEKATVFISTPTFLRPILKRAEPAQLRSLRFVVTGAEKLPVDLFEQFLQKFGVRILQGYGLTETTPVVGVNLPEPRDLPKGVKVQEGHRLGSVGRLFAGMTARIVHPETGEVLPPDETGILWLRGANVFGGYLKDPVRTAESLHDGWFVTGDLARFDDDGFLFIEGRLSRFSKVGGEMVPHLTIEQKIVELFGLEPGEAPKVVVLGVPDAAKGETLVLLTTEPIDAAQLREKLTAAGLPNLWIPKIVHRLDRIPVLGSGKCDLRGCRELATKPGADGSAG